MFKAMGRGDNNESTAVDLEMIFEPKSPEQLMETFLSNPWKAWEYAEWHDNKELYLRKAQQIYKQAQAADDVDQQLRALRFLQFDYCSHTNELSQLRQKVITGLEDRLANKGWNADQLQEQLIKNGLYGESDMLAIEFAEGDGYPDRQAYQRALQKALAAHVSFINSNKRILTVIETPDAYTPQQALAALASLSFIVNPRESHYADGRDDDTLKPYQQESNLDAVTQWQRYNYSTIHNDLSYYLRGRAQQRYSEQTGIDPRYFGRMDFENDYLENINAEQTLIPALACCANKSEEQIIRLYMRAAHSEQGKRFYQGIEY